MMALIRCTECGKQISDKSVACINCGAPIELMVQPLGAETPSSERDGSSSALANNNSGHHSSPSTLSANTLAAIIITVLAAIVGATYLYFDNEREEKLAAEQARRDAVYKAEQDAAAEALPLQTALDLLAGTNVAQDYKAAYEALKVLAEQPPYLAIGGRQSRAATELGRMLLEGKGVPKDEVGAASWFRLAYKVQGNDAWGTRTSADNFAALQLGLMYEKGNGVPKDLELAYAWFNVAAAQDGYYPKFLVPGFLERQTQARKKRDSLAALLPGDKLEKAQQMIKSRDFWGLQ